MKRQITDTDQAADRSARALQIPCVATVLMSMLLAVLLVYSGVASAETLTATVDRKRVALEETLQLSVRIDTQTLLGEPDFSLLDDDFDILGRQQSRQMRSVNGRTESWTQWNLTLAPKREGRLQIPVFELKGARSQALEVEVQALSTPATVADRDYYLELEVDKEQLYEQEQLLVRVRLLSAISLTGLQGATLTIDNANVVKLDEAQYERVLQGRRYGIYEVSYAVFPQKSGPLTIPAQRFSAVRNATRSVFGRSGGQRVRLSSQPRVLDVLPRPPGFQAAEWLPAAALQLTQSWGSDKPEFRVGEPVTRTLTLKVSGLEAAQLPPTTMADIPGVKIYPEPPRSEEKSNTDGFVVERTERFGLVPGRAGKFKLPAVRLRWWDTVAGRERLAELPAETISVLPAPGSVGAAPVTQPASAPAAAQSPLTSGAPGDSSGQSVREVETLERWLLWSNAAWALLVLILTLFWWRARRAVAPTQSLAQSPLQLSASDSLFESEASAFKQLEAACESASASAIRTALIRWQESRFGGEYATNPADLDSLWDEIGDAELQQQLRQQLQQLERTLFGVNPSHHYAGGALLSALRRLRSQLTESEKTTSAVLPPLYRSA